ncbi:MAG: hypothetical protein IT305_18205 [Chloroflexi bacterium]|nr:hypothetical protein [Chloroflexota bacterium]
MLAAPDAPRSAHPSAPCSRAGSRWLTRWLAPLLCVVLGLLFAVHTSWPALVDPLVVADDARQHAFWWPRLHDPSLFPNDPIADYYQAEAPPGFVAVAWALTLATDTVTASAILPLLLTVVLAAGAFALGRSLWRRTDAALLGAVLLCWSAWQYDDLSSSSPRGFAMPLLVVFLAALAARRDWLAVLLVALQALLYPLGCATMLGTWMLLLAGRFVAAAVRAGSGKGIGAGVGVGIGEAAGTGTAVDTGTSMGTGTRAGAGAGSGAGGTDRPSSAMGAVRALGRAPIWLGLAVVLAVLLFTLGQQSARAYGPSVTAEQARGMPEFQSGGRASYFIPDPVRFWLDSTRSGLALTVKDPLLGGLPALTIPFVLAVGLVIWGLAGWRRWCAPPVVPRDGAWVLVALLATSLLLFGAAHLLLYALYLPARHVQFSLPIVWALAGGLAWALLGDRIGDRLSDALGNVLTRRQALQGRVRSLGWFRSAAPLAGLTLLVLHAPPVGTFYVAGRHPAIYAYLRTTPPAMRVAALPTDSSMIPLLAERPVLVSWEHALPYHATYYVPLRARMRALSSAYYAESPVPLARLLGREQVGIVLANVSALERYQQQVSGRAPALAALAEQCGVFRERELVVVPAACIRRAATETQPG